MNKEHINDIVNLATEFEKKDIECTKDYMYMEKELQKDYYFAMRDYNIGKIQSQPKMPTHERVLELLKLHYKGTEIIGNYN